MIDRLYERPYDKIRDRIINVTLSYLQTSMG